MTPMHPGPQLHLTRFSSASDAYAAYEWLDRFKDVAEMCQWEDLQKLIFARNSLEGQASSWYSAHKSKINTWADFEKLFIDRFAADSNSIANALYSRRQNQQESVRAYADDF